MKIVTREPTVTAALAAAFAVLWLSMAGSSGGQSGPIVSVDAMPDASNTATTLGSVDYCRIASDGSAFLIDVVIQAVTGLTGLEGHLLYNASVLRVTGVSYNYLIGSAGGGLVELGDLTPDTDGDFKLAVVTFPLTPATGTGVLARLTVEAIGAGSSPLDLQSIKLSDALGNPIQPADPVTGFFTGSVNDATVVIGGACADADGDGFTDTDEAWVGTNSLDNCGSHTTTPPIYSEAWPADLYSGASFDPTTDRITIADLNTFLAPRRLNTNPGDANYSKRWDLSPGPGIFTDDINIQDLSVLLTLRPGMLGGAYAFNGPACTP